MEVVISEKPRRSRWFAAAWVISVGLFLTAPVSPTMSSRGGGLIAALVFAAVIRGVYMLIRRLLKREQVRFLHPWLFGIAAILSAVTFIGATGSA